VAVGYPGVPGNPNDKPKPDEKVEGQVLGSDPVNSLVRLPNHDIVVVPNDRVKKSG
jgi:hypothetical protein